MSEAERLADKATGEITAMIGQYIRSGQSGNDKEAMAFAIYAVVHKAIAALLRTPAAPIQATSNELAAWCDERASEEIAAAVVEKYAAIAALLRTPAPPPFDPNELGLAGVGPSNVPMPAPAPAPELAARLRKRLTMNGGRLSVDHKLLDEIREAIDALDPSPPHAEEP